MNIFSIIADKIVNFIGSVSWNLEDPVTEDEKQHIRELLKNDYYIILTRNNNHLSTYAIAFSHLILSGKWGYWAHSLMNLEDEVKSDADFRLVEATRAGVNYAKFDEVFATNSVVLLKPRNMPVSDWTTVLDNAKSHLGKPYDTLYDLSSDNALSCVELVRVALQATPNYDKHFFHFEALISKSRNLTPQMFYDCPDFEVVYEVRKK